MHHSDQNIPVSGNPAAQRVAGLRDWMQANDLQAVIVPTADPHLSEYLPQHWALREWISGFAGSAGTVVIGMQFAGLWTDSRYWVQAQADLHGSGITLMRAGAPDVPSVSRWLASNLPRGARAGIDGRMLSLAAQRQWQTDLDDAGIVLDTSVDPAAGLWHDRPALPRQAIAAHLPPHACRTLADNLQAVRQAMHEHGAQWHWLSSLDDIAWLFNLRGTDIPYNPVFLAHALIGQECATLFVQPGAMDPALAQSLAHDGVQIGDYAQATAALQALPQGQTLLIDPARTTVDALRHAQQLKIVRALHPSQLLKSRKNGQELQNVRQAMVQDGIALCEFFTWLDARLAKGGATGAAQGDGVITELTIDERLTQARARRPGFVCPSFGTIAAFNANGAMPHYHATPASHAVIQGDGLLLIDSGGQYLGGTTDITRVVPIGQPSAAQKRDFTVVLQGMIALSRLVFPQGISAGALDAVARAPIWREGADYGHGTGHGVGYFLNVHEGPQSISHRSANLPDTGMQPGMITSNEPGLYRAGQWGIRIENLLAAVPARQSEEFGAFLAFDTLTLCPIDTRCIDAMLLDDAQRAWLNDYHATVYEQLAPHLQGDALDWLRVRVQAI